MSDEVLNEHMYTCGHTREQLALMGEGRWGKNRLTYFVQNYDTEELSKEEWDAVIAKAFGNWTAVCNLHFSIAPNAQSADIVITFARGRRPGLDGRLGILAMCELPRGTNFDGQLNLTIDADEDWGGEIKPENVLTHEIGHGIGQGHTNVPKQLMNPMYSERIATPQSHDRQVAVADYGPPSAVPAPPPTPTPVPTPTGSVPCKCLIGGVVYAGELKPQSGASKVEFNE